MAIDEWVRYAGTAIVAIVLLNGRILFGDYWDFLSHEQNGGLPGEWLSSLAPDARQAAMGSALAASEGSHSAAANPSGLAHSHQAETTLMAAPLVAAGRYAAVSLSHPLGSRRFAGFSMLHLASGEAEKTDELGRNAGSFSEQDFAFALAYAERVTHQAHAGFSFKTVYQTIDERSGAALGLDAGLKFRDDGGGWSIGILAQNLVQPRIRLDDERERFPVTFRLAPSARLTARGSLCMVTAEAAWIKPFGTFQFWRMGAGFELSMVRAPSFLFRMGANSRELSVGFGLKNGPISFDYAALWQALGLTHRLGVTFRYGYVGPLAEKSLNDQWTRINAKEAELAALFGEAQRQGFMVQELSGPRWKMSLDEISSDLSYGHLDRAEQRLTRLLLLSPGHPDLVALKAKLQELRDQAMAISARERAIALYHSKDYEEALESSRSTLKIIKNDPAAGEIEMMALAQIDITQGRYDLALKRLKKAIEANPDNDEAVRLFRRTLIVIEELLK
ncbi:MAG: hypothetical protein HY547_01625 [Elusimicrobia bacterium]|nr:hypothetical protein [Elusimicrobiota bacterium]